MPLPPVNFNVLPDIVDEELKLLIAYSRLLLLEIRIVTSVTVGEVASLNKPGSGNQIGSAPNSKSIGDMQSARMASR